MELSSFDLQDLRAHTRVERVGSRLIQGAWTEESDWDYLALYTSDAAAYLEDCGFIQDATYEYPADQPQRYVSYRKDAFNIIFVPTAEQFKRALLAQKVCEALKLTNKHDRIIVWDAIEAEIFPDEVFA